MSFSCRSPPGGTEPRIARLARACYRPFPLAITGVVSTTAIFSDWAGSFIAGDASSGLPFDRGTRAVPVMLQEWPQQFERQREDDGGILIRGYVREGLEVAHLHRHGIGSHDLGGLPELVGGLELTLGVDNLRSPVAFGLRLAGHRPLHRARGGPRP